MGVWVDHLRMIIQMNDSKLRTIEKIELFLSGNVEVAFSMQGDDTARYAHISRVFKRLAYPQRNKRERGVVLRYLQRTSGYSRSQVTRLVTPWRANRLAAVPLLKHYRAPAGSLGEMPNKSWVTVAPSPAPLRVCSARASR
jgi:hypothetical protein